MHDIIKNKNENYSKLKGDISKIQWKITLQTIFSDYFKITVYLNII